MYGLAPMSYPGLEQLSHIPEMVDNVTGWPTDCVVILAKQYVFVSHLYISM